MKLLVIVMCLLSERFLMHVSAYTKFHWFNSYKDSLKNKLNAFNSGFVLLLVILPILLLVWFVLYLFGHVLFGIIGLILNIFIFFYCIGPENPFYPLREENTASKNIANEESNEAGLYLVKVNSQLFTVILWYVLLGPLAILTYRLIYLSKEDSIFHNQAKILTDIIEWLPARLTAFLYLLVGNFQDAVGDFMRLFFNPPQKNPLILQTCGLKALGDVKEESLPRAEILVEHAVIVLLVLMAFITMAAKL